MVTDAIADVLWTPSADANENLIAEGIATEKIDLIGNIMIDSFEMLRATIESANSREKLVITDSGGLQEETTYLDIPCLTMRENTERPIMFNTAIEATDTQKCVRQSLVRIPGGSY